jgi:hypothetical protein
MMGFTGEELLLSVLHAVIYGGACSVIYCILKLLCDLPSSLGRVCKDIAVYENILSVKEPQRYVILGKRGWLFSFLGLIAYFVGFLLLSYYSLDGQVRIYMLLISSASFYVFDLSFCVVLRRIILFLFYQILAIVTVALRIVLLPIKIFVRKFYKKDLNI